MPYATGAAADFGELGEAVNSKAPINHAAADGTYGLAGDGQYGHILFTRQGSATTHLPVMNGIANTGLGLRAARHDHVHPVDTGRAPTNHASTQPVHGTASETEYGHVQLATSLPAGNGVAAIGVSQRAAREDHVHPAQSIYGLSAAIITAHTDTVLSFENGGWRTVAVGPVAGLSKLSVVSGQSGLIEIAADDRITFLQDGSYLIHAVLSTYDGQQRQMRLSLNNTPFAVSPPSGEGEYQIQLAAMGMIGVTAGQQLSVEAFNRSGLMYVPSSAAFFSLVQDGTAAGEGFKPYMQLSLLRLG